MIYKKIFSKEFLNIIFSSINITLKFFEGTRYPEINKKIEKFVNKKKCFPDYNDIRDIIVSVNNSRALHLK